MRKTLLLALVACAHPPARDAKGPPRAETSKAPREPGSNISPHAIALPGATGPLFLDYLAYDPAHDRVWIPAGGTGRVDVIDAKTEQVTAIEGFPTKEVDRRGKKMTTGPTSATVGDGVVYIGNRADSSVCAVDAATLEKRDCATLDSSPDGLQYVAATKELWVTTPRDKSIRIFDVAAPGHPTAKDKIAFEGEPEGFAIDNAHGVFYTNLEDKDETLAIDVKTRAITKHWQPKCGEDGPKGLALDAAANHLIVVCPDHIETLDGNGQIIATLQVGKGLDAIDLVPARHLVAAAGGGVAKISFATLEADGKLVEFASIATTRGARNAVLAANGTAFVAVGPSGSILVVPAPAPEAR
jgi:hypothetical protein